LFGETRLFEYDGNGQRLGDYGSAAAAVAASILLLILIEYSILSIFRTESNFSSESIAGCKQRN